MDENNAPRLPRPESTIAQSFSADLDSMFGLSDSGNSAQLEQTVEQKKQTVSSTQQELEELVAKLKATEERLARVSRGNSPARPAQANIGAPRQYSDQQQARVGSSPLAQKPAYPADRPPTGGARPAATREDTQALMAGMPGALPQTPKDYSGSSEYVMVDRNGARPSGGYGQSVG